VGETFPDLYPVAEALDGPLVKVGANAPGEWAEYSATLATTSTLQPTLLYASATTTGRILFTVAGVSWDVLLPPTGGWRNWVAITGPEVVIPAGEHILRALIIDAGADWYSLRFNRVEPVTPVKKPNKPRLEKLK
jgi:hypothetical protein